MLLHEGWNLVAWMGFDGVTAEHALAALGSDLSVALSWDRATGRFLQYSADPGTDAPSRLQRGHPLWVSVAAERDWPQAVPLEPEMVFHGDVSEARHADVRARVYHVVAHYAERLGTYRSATTFHFTANGTLFAEVTRLLGRVSPRGCRQHGEGVVFFDLSCGLDTFHWAYFQGLLIHMGTMKSQEPGGWVLAGWQWYEDLLYRDSLRAEFPTSYRSYEAAIEEHRERLSQEPPPVEQPLRQWVPQSVDLRMLGVDWLVRRAGTHSPYEYHQALVRGERWEDAFTDAFGLTLEAFYDQFEASVASIVGWPVTGSFLNRDGEELRAWRFEATAQPVAGAGDRENGDGIRGFSMYLHPGTYEFEIDVRCEGQTFPLGWYDGEGGLTTDRAQAGHVVVDGSDVSIDVKLSRLPSEVSPLCELAPRITIEGMVTDPDDQPVPDLYVRGFRFNYFTLSADERKKPAEDATVTGDDGRFTLSVLDEYTYWILVNSATCEGGRGKLLGAYDSVTGFTHGGTNRYGESTHVVVQGEDVTGIHVPLAAREYDIHLQDRQRCSSSGQPPGR